MVPFYTCSVRMPWLESPELNGVGRKILDLYTYDPKRWECWELNTSVTITEVYDEAIQ